MDYHPGDLQTACSIVGRVSLPAACMTVKVKRMTHG